MKSPLLSSCCFFVLLSAVCSDALVLRGRHERRTAAEIREFQRARRNQTNKIHRDFLPLYPEEPLTLEVKIGTPKDKTEPLTYKLALSTANPSMWTLDVSYGGLTKDNVPYDRQASKTADYRGPYYSYTDDTQLYGLIYGDVLNFTTLGDYSLVFKQSFGVVQSATDPDSSVSNPSFPADGVFGLSWDIEHPVVDPDEDSAPVLNILHRAPDIKRGNYFYTLWLTNSSSPDKDAGRHYDWQLTFGALDHDHCDRHYNTTYLDWYTEYAPTTFYMKRFQFGDVITTDVSGEHFMIDTGSPVIFFPERIYGEMYYSFNPDFDWDLGYYTVDCGETGDFPDWTSKLEGTKLKEFA
ncbi:hypothetical protein M3Y99_01324000 [Aphelenchoides fujianensis]|nr:hypothetical protein M3Y99_01324000 [Aphelenchoides fujianensis]